MKAHFYAVGGARLGASLLLLGSLLPFSNLALAREAGWVRIPPVVNKSTPAINSPAQQKKAINGKARQSAQKPPNAPQSVAKTVYDNQPPVTEAELGRFLEVLPSFRRWSHEQGEEAHPILNASGKPDFFYSARAGQWVREHKFAPGRFFCIMGRLAAGLVIIEEGNDFKGTRPPDMPTVTSEELQLARKHLGELIRIGSQSEGAPDPKL